MPVFSEHSKKQLAGCDPRLETIARIAIRIMDFRVLEGHRDRDRQNELKAAGKSQLSWPRSRHNKSPSLAMDLAPWPVDWQDTSRFYLLAGIILAIAWFLRIPIRWGGDWNKDMDTRDNKFQDLGHFEIDE